MIQYTSKSKQSCPIKERPNMTALEAAFAEAAKLPTEEQEAFARWMMAELATERKWTQLFEGSADALAALGEEALAEYRAGRTQALDPNEL
jgi:hypothetical protein